jgi:hypothetical protein
MDPSAQIDQESRRTVWTIGSGMRTYRTPAAPRTNIHHTENGEFLISSGDQTKLRSGVGMILYLAKCSKPDIAMQSDSYPK